MTLINFQKHRNLLSSHKGPEYINSICIWKVIQESKLIGLYRSDCKKLNCLEAVSQLWSIYNCIINICMFTSRIKCHMLLSTFCYSLDKDGSWNLVVEVFSEVQSVSPVAGKMEVKLDGTPVTHSMPVTLTANNSKTRFEIKIDPVSLQLLMPLLYSFNSDYS